jgi:Leucine-rich repeat (LRR) protein
MVDFDGEFGEYVMNDGLSFAYRDLEALPDCVVAEPGSPAWSRNEAIVQIDLSETFIKSLERLQHFPKLQTLILDKNDMADLGDCPKLPSVTTLWFNNNKIECLPGFMDQVLERFPNVVYLSVMRNPACGGLIDHLSPDPEAERLYRLYILHRCPKLAMIDSTDVSAEEVKEAAKRGQYAARRKSAGAPQQKGWFGRRASSGSSDNLSSSTEKMEAVMGSAAAEQIAQEGGKKARAPSFKGQLRGFNPTAPQKMTKTSEGNRFIVNSQL